MSTIKKRKRRDVYELCEVFFFSFERHKMDERVLARTFCRHRHCVIKSKNGFSICKCGRNCSLQKICRLMNMKKTGKKVGFLTCIFYHV